jgi:hypothetical protein
MHSSAPREFVDKYLLSVLVPLAWCWYIGIALVIYVNLELIKIIPDGFHAAGWIVSFLVLFYDHFFRAK